MEQNPQSELVQKDVWLDCDPGQDDAIAIVLAAHNPKINLLGISAVCGNVPIEKTYNNAIKMAGIVGAPDIPVVAGQDRPLVVKPSYAEFVHGESGMDGSPTFDSFLREKEIPELWRKAKGVFFMAEQIEGNANKVTILATAPLTNVALFLRLYPELHSKIEQIVLMGGAMGMGNNHPCAEYNIACDPEAAKIVFDCGLSVTMVPIEVTHTAIVTADILAKISAMDSTFSRMIVELIQHVAFSEKEDRGFEDGPPYHDPCAVAYVIAPEMFETKFLNVDVVCGEHMCQGSTVCDIWKSTGKQPNVNVAVKMDVPKFWEMLLTALRKCNDITPLNKKD